MTLELSAITAEKHCYCGHKKSQHSVDSKCHGKKNGGPCWLCRDGFRLSGYDPQEPTVEKTEGIHAATVSNHPAFGQIGASRVSGGEYLYGSDFKHQHYIVVQIHESTQYRELSGA